MTYKGNGYLGSSTLETSTANQELIPEKQIEWTYGYKIRKLSFINKQSTQIIINSETTLFLDANQGFEMDENDEPITSFIVVEAGINFQWIAGY